VLQTCLVLQGCTSEKTYQRLAARAPTDASFDAHEASAARDAPATPPRADVGADLAAPLPDARTADDGGSSSEVSVTVDAAGSALDARDPLDASSDVPSRDALLGDGAVGDGLPTADAGAPSDGASPDRRPLAAACTTNEDCATGHCSDGVCCNEACTGPCESCNLPGLTGNCNPVGPGKASARCGVGPVCGFTGLCGPDGQCAFASVLTVCMPASCQNGAARTAAYCDGRGGCSFPSYVSCGGAGCDPTGRQCLASCPRGDAICGPGSYCTGNETCLPKKASGSACGSDHECLGNDCRGGVCTSPDGGPRPPFDASARF